MKQIYDVIIVGGGPAGLSAAIYLARAKFSVLVIEKEKFGGQITITDEVVNYPGVLKTSGKELTENMRKQAENFGAKFLLTTVKEMQLKDDIKRIITDKGTFESIGVILATGSSPRKLGFKGEKEFQGHGVAYCATCDGEFFSGLDVFVIGGGFAAAEEAVFLTKYARNVHIIVREPDFTCAATVADKAKNHPKIKISYNTEIKEAIGDEELKEATFINNQTKEEWTYRASDNESFGIFVFAGYEPATQLFSSVIECNRFGNVIVDKNQKTNLNGVYAAGDVCEKDLRQIVTAVSDGATAATSLERYIPKVVEKLNVETVKLEESKKVEDVEDMVTESFINNQIRNQLQGIFSKLTKDVEFVVEDNESSLSKEMISFVKEFVTTSNRFSYKIVKGDEASIKLFVNNEYQRVSFHAVPGGHEFNSFVIAIYNVAGPKQSIDEKVLKEIQSITSKINLKVIVSLSCTMCPDVVMSSQRIAIENKNIEAEVFDFAHYPDLKQKYKIMSVPALVINDEKVIFGKKDIKEILSNLK